MTIAFKTPQFWYQKPGILAWILWPLSLIYKFGYVIRQSLFKTQKADIPVICIGNITAGGSGKTPASIALAHLLIKSQLSYKKPFFLTRGYGGDEDALLSRVAPTIVNANRYEGARQAYQNGADFIIMDDGMQNQSLYKDFTLMVIDGETGFGNEFLLPAGPLRETVSNGLKHANGFLIIGEDKHNIVTRLPHGKPVIRASIISDLSNVDKNKPICAFTGLAHPEKFKRTLENNGLTINQFIAFPDHHAYLQSDIRKITDTIDTQILTTEKDFVKLKTLEGANKIQAVPIRLEFDNENDILAIIQGLTP